MTFYSKKKMSNELTFLWNDLTIEWNDLTWNDLTMERTNWISTLHIHPQLVDLEGTALLTMINLNTSLFVLFCLFIYLHFVSCCDMVDDFLAQ